MEYKTPLLKQYFSLVDEYPGAIILMRVGDFYETYGKIAVLTSKLLGITLTKKVLGKDGDNYNMELSGFPYHSLDSYLSKLIQNGYKIAICDQLEDASKAKGLVKRGVTEVVTPGLITQETVLNNKKNNYLVSFIFYKNFIGVAFLDISTGEFFANECDNIDKLQKLLDAFQPNEVIYPKEQEQYLLNLIDRGLLKLDKNKVNNSLPDWVYKKTNAEEIIKNHFKILNLKGLGLEDKTLATVAACAILQYLKNTGHNNISHITTISTIDIDKYMYLDKHTISNLEILKSQHDKGIGLIDILDNTITSMGGRLLRKWLTLPLVNLNDILNRQNKVTIFYNCKDISNKIMLELVNIIDLERVLGKISFRRACPKDFIALKNSLKTVVNISNIVKDLNIGIKFYDCSELIDKIDKTISENSFNSDFINYGIDSELDEYKSLKNNSNFKMKELLQSEISKTGINSLKIGYNKIYGYYFEVTNTHKNKVPDIWTRKQTTTTGERYICDDLKEFEEKILIADSKITEIENKIFNELILFTLQFSKQILYNSTIIASLDCYINLAQLALKNNYVCPIINNDNKIDIKNGRHPVIEHMLKLPDFFVANDIYLDNEKQQIMLITGPNMSGKSALLREVALIVLLAQIGSYVPADYAEIGIIDRIFTRIGASDNLSSGESTFMVEMSETANILHNITERSLILMDEIGRGTSTYDGISISCAIVEYIHNSKYKPKTLFATHYHELSDLETRLERLKNYRLSILEKDGKIIFIRKLEKGSTEHSFGIHVARLSGIPSQVIERAKVILRELESKNVNGNINNKSVENQSNNVNSEYKERYEHLKDILKAIDINNSTPIEILIKLNDIIKKLN